MNLTVKASTLQVQKDNGHFSDPVFNLKPGFTGKHVVANVEEVTEFKKPDSVIAHRVLTKSANGLSSLHSAVLARSIILNDDKALKKIKSAVDGAKSIWYADEIAHLSNVTLHHLYERNEDGSFKDHVYEPSLTVLGAVVFRSQDGADHPQVAMRRYSMYRVLAQHHRRLGSESYMTWEDAVRYSKAVGADRPVGLPADYEFALPSPEAALEMSNWNFTLIIKDWRE